MKKIILIILFTVLSSSVFGQYGNTPGIKNEALVIGIDVLGFPLSLIENMPADFCYRIGIEIQFVQPNSLFGLYAFTGATAIGNINSANMLRISAGISFHPQNEGINGFGVRLFLQAQLDPNVSSTAETNLDELIIFGIGADIFYNFHFSRTGLSLYFSPYAGMEYFFGDDLSLTKMIRFGLVIGF